MTKEKGKKIFGECGLVFFDDGACVGIKMQTSVSENTPKEVQQAILLISKIIETSFPEIIRQISNEVKLQ